MKTYRLPYIIKVYGSICSQVRIKTEILIIFFNFDLNDESKAIKLQFIFPKRFEINKNI